jgi:hypothetical protein
MTRPEGRREEEDGRPHRLCRPGDVLGLPLAEIFEGHLGGLSLSRGCTQGTDSAGVCDSGKDRNVCSWRIAESPERAAAFRPSN